MSSWPVPLSFSSTASLLPDTRPCHPTPSRINACNPLCGRVTSATVRNRVKLNRHRREGEAPQINQQRCVQGLCRDCRHLTRDLKRISQRLAGWLEKHCVHQLHRVSEEHVVPTCRPSGALNFKDEGRQRGIQHRATVSVLGRFYYYCFDFLLIFWRTFLNSLAYWPYNRWRVGLLSCQVRLKGFSLSVHPEH